MTIRFETLLKQILGGFEYLTVVAPCTDVYSSCVNQDTLSKDWLRTKIPLNQRFFRQFISLEKVYFQRKHYKN